MVAVTVVLALLVGLVALVAAATMVAWNIVMPAVFGLPTIDYVQAFAVVFLLSLIRGGVSYIRSE